MTDKSAMADYEVKECLYITGTPDADGDSPFFKVGEPSYVACKPKSEWPIVERITLQHDVNGEYCMRTRACVWVDGKLFFECPYQALTGVGYAL
ncbi:MULTISPECIES: hypothetical protein [Acetobacter]|uniref:hypothetical protein n=1 Tax=Acetobacter TaxID=434 RepID=UPI000676EFD4|nr:hypothetical protein [Acetobacter pasteurianus]AKR48458.1 hypothetical protein DB34_05580 [Acetobacter pasteurianus]